MDKICERCSFGKRWTSKNIRNSNILSEQKRNCFNKWANKKLTFLKDENKKSTDTWKYIGRETRYLTRVGRCSCKCRENCESQQHRLEKDYHCPMWVKLPEGHWREIGTAKDKGIQPERKVSTVTARYPNPQTKASWIHNQSKGSRSRQTHGGILPREILWGKKP